MIKIGIAGFGKMGKIRAKTVVEHKDTELIAVFEQDSELVGDTLSNNIKRCKSYDELLCEPLDAIIICAFNHVAVEYSTKALLKGIHVFCEKPPAKNCQELSLVLQAEKTSQKVLKYGFNHRWHYSVQEAKKLIDSGEMGKPLWVRGVYGKAGSIDYHKNWRNFKKYSAGGILMDQGIHMLDLYHYLLDKNFEVISSQLTNAYWKVEVEDNAFVTLKDNNFIATIHSSANQWRHKFLIEICFEHGYINLDGILSDSRSYAPETLIVGKREFEDITFAMGKPKETTTWFENDDSWSLELAEFVNAIQGKGHVSHGTSKDAQKVLSLVERIYEHSGFYHDK